MDELFKATSPLNWLIIAGYLATTYHLWSNAVDKESRGKARWALMSLGSIGFFFAMGRYLSGAGYPANWLYFCGHVAMIFHGWFTIHVSRWSREHAQHQQARIDDLEAMLGEVTSERSAA